MKILIIGSGGREHALCWAISASPLCDALYCAPGSDAIASLAKPVPIKVDDCAKLVEFAMNEQIDLVVIGPELPLTLGLANQLRANHIAVVGPDQAAAKLEGSKAYAREFCQKYGIAGAEFQLFNALEPALDYLEQCTYPIVVKADGLAAGKGVVVATTKAEAKQAATHLIEGAGGGRLVIEECLVGQEISFFALCDGDHALPLMAARDHKRAFDGDQGPNTGGMGVFAPVALVDEALEARIMKEIIQPTLHGMRQEQAPYRGILFLGLMITKDGPKLIEYNVRFGDPECQVLMRLLFSDIVPALIATDQGGLDQINLRWQENHHAVCVVVAKQGYPESPTQDKLEIDHLQPMMEAEKEDETKDNVTIFHAGTKQENGKWLANGGRVLNFVGVGKNLADARHQTYQKLEALNWTGGFYRSDIAKSGG